MTLALSKINTHSVETRWSDATSPTAPWQKAQGDPEWAGEAVLRDRREAITEVSAEKFGSRLKVLAANMVGLVLTSSGGHVDLLIAQSAGSAYVVVAVILIFYVSVKV